MTRAVPAAITLALLLGVLALDLAAAPPNPFKAPKAFALGSGMVASGGFCGALPN